MKEPQWRDRTGTVAFSYLVVMLAGFAVGVVLGGLVW